MNTVAKITLISGIASVAVSIAFGVMDIRDSRRGKKRMNKNDIDAIADGVVERIGEMADEYQENLEPKIEPES